MKTLMHYGSFPGFYSLITIVPEMRFGLFTSINGGEQDYPWTLNSLIHTVAIDLALDDQPWTLYQAACIFPPGSLEMMNTDPFVIDGSQTSQRPLEEYTGVYYHPIFNNVTFSLFNRTHLQAKLGDIEFHAFPHSEKDSFTLLVIDKGWYIGPATITFYQGSGSSNVIDQVEIPFLETNDPPLFKRQPQNTDILQWRQVENEACITSRVRESSYALVSEACSLCSSTLQIIWTFISALVLEMLFLWGR